MSPENVVIMICVLVFLATTFYPDLTKRKRQKKELDERIKRIRKDEH